MLRLLPGLAVMAPADAMEVRGALRAALGQTSPVYMRIGKKGEPVIHPSTPDLTIGKAIVVREGTDVCILSAGNMLPISASGVTTKLTSGIATALASGLTSDTCANNSIVSGTSPSVTHHASVLIWGGYDGRMS